MTDSRQGFAGGHDRNAFDLSKGEHVSLVTGDDQVGLSGDCCAQNRVVCGVGGQIHPRRLVKDKSTRTDVLNDGRGFVSVQKLVQTGPGEHIGDLGFCAVDVTNSMSPRSHA